MGIMVLYVPNSGQMTIFIIYNCSICKGAGQITAGDGLEKSGNTLSIDAKSNSGCNGYWFVIKFRTSSITGTLAVSDGGTSRSLDNLITWNLATGNYVAV